MTCEPCASELTDLEHAKQDRLTYGISSRAFEAWREQRYSAKRRGIPFRFTLLSWWLWWRSNLPNGATRGRRRGEYVMARKGDAGAYEPENVICITAAENLQAVDKNKRSSSCRETWRNKMASGYVSHLSNRERHPCRKEVKTPLGQFESASLAAEAHGIPKRTAQRLARSCRSGWSYLYP